ncbi:uncharacterized protein PHALS_02244 [Plasmopara halstedii]|uniref:Uncharacterized protein n=1 Tax=Plasmopara halstedii TaxID=4781 RepID=A0A0P1AU93_PLAHL|nr:uncharacterized protein PHALS_02244 [Plasmopara halstedii]CEG45910.1 hypothetical protein PHALS_02244 [Plasmopara halstedii]|eukprot:XP_024582279.1 hypothetical protein PHALS_02244 [Plasmopara halstedii]
MRGDEAVGYRVQIYWEGENEWYEGVVDKYSVEKGYYIKYDDGEEQWEFDKEEYPIRFLSKVESKEVETDPIADMIQGNNYHANVTTRSNSESEISYSDDTDSEQEDLQMEQSDSKASDDLEEERHNLKAASRTSGKENAMKSDFMVSTNFKSVNPARAFMRTSTIFFRDEESLREMRQKLRQEKKLLTNQIHILKLQLTEKELVAASLQTDLRNLHTSAALANVMHEVPKSANFSSKCGNSFKPRTAVEWNERILDQKLENKSTSNELVILKTAVQDKQFAIKRKERQRDELSAELARVPRRYLCTLVDLQIEISQLLKEKRLLDCHSQPSLESDDKGTTTTAALQNELAGLEVTTERYKDQLRQWHFKMDCEKARLAPLQERLVSLHQELECYKDSQTLLRSAFLLLEPDSCDECVSLDGSLTVFQMLTPPGRDALSVEEMAARLKESGIEQQRFSFTQFVAAFNCLCNSWN